MRCECCNSKYECECSCDYGANQFSLIDKIQTLKQLLELAVSDFDCLCLCKDYHVCDMCKVRNHIKEELKKLNENT